MFTKWAELFHTRYRLLDFLINKISCIIAFKTDFRQILQYYFIHISRVVHQLYRYQQP